RDFFGQRQTVRAAAGELVPVFRQPDGELLEEEIDGEETDERRADRRAHARPVALAAFVDREEAGAGGGWLCGRRATTAATTGFAAREFLVAFVVPVVAIVIAIIVVGLFGRAAG